MARPIAFMLPLLACIGCSPAAGVKATGQKMTPAEAKEAATGLNPFAFNLLRAMESPDAGENALVSPFSIRTALSMVVPGVQGAPQTELLKALESGTEDPSQLHKRNGALREALLSAEGNPLQIANSVWVKEGLKVKEPFLQSLKSQYAAHVDSFKHDQASVDKINAWVKQNTKERIPTIIQSIQPLERVFLINAIAFDGEWKEEFDPKDTRDREFRAPGGTVQVPTMNLQAKVPFVVDGDFRAIRLDYKDGQYGMVLVLPKEDQAAWSALAQMNAESLETLLGEMSEQETRIALPRFKFSDEYELSSTLSSMGLAQFFDVVDLSAIAPDLAEGRISRVIHKTFIDVDEKGTKAAAATSVGIAVTSMPQIQEFIADRPFLFFIRHNPSGAIIFSGVVNDPTKN